MVLTRTLVHAFRTVGRHVRTAFEGVAFWSAVFLPLVYVPAMTLPGVVPLSEHAVVSVVGVHVLALAVGHGHNQRDDVHGHGADRRR